MFDRRKFHVLAGGSVLLILLAITYEPLIETRLLTVLEAAKRQRHYEQAIRGKGLPLHEGVFWKTKE